MTQTPTVSHQPKGWEHIVNQINAADDQTTFLAGMLQLQCMIVAADYGAMWLVTGESQLGLAETWPTTLAEHGPESNVMKMLQQAAGTGLQRTSSQILKLQIGEDAGHQVSDKDAASLVFVTVMRSRGRITAISTAVAESRDANVAKVTLPMRELAAGLFESFESRRDAKNFRLDSESVRKAMALLAVSQEGRGFQGGCLNLVNELARQEKCTRVSLGWIKGHSVRVMAMSDTEHLKRHDEQVTMAEFAMSECLDQQQPIVQPITEGTEPLLAHAVVHAHRRLTGDHPNKHVLSIPLRHDDEWLGVLMLERTETPFDDQVIQSLQLVSDVVAPHLNDRRQSDRFLVTHTWHSFTKTAGYLVGPKHVGWKLLAILVIAAASFAVFGSWPYRVKAEFTLEALDKRILPTAYEGRLEEVMSEPGDLVEAGQILARMDATEWKLQYAQEQATRKKAAVERAKATAENKQADAQIALARIEEADAKMELLKFRIDRSIIRSPVDGFVLSDYWHDKVGGVIEKGKTMFEVAPIESLIVLARVSEKDIDLIDGEQLQSGYMATRSIPGEDFEIQVIRVVPAAKPVDKANVFEVRCSIEDPADWLRPGMEGIARIEIGEKRIMWIATHRIASTIRLWFWQHWPFGWPVWP